MGHQGDGQPRNGSDQVSRKCALCGDPAEWVSHFHRNDQGLCKPCQKALRDKPKEQKMTFLEALEDFIGNLMGLGIDMNEARIIVSHETLKRIHAKELLEMGGTTQEWVGGKTPIDPQLNRIAFHVLGCWVSFSCEDESTQPEQGQEGAEQDPVDWMRRLSVALKGLYPGCPELAHLQAIESISRDAGVPEDAIRKFLDTGDS